MSSNHVVCINSIRYRGYYYDEETGLYYLNSRYYDPVTGRFLNADGMVYPQTGVIGINTFAYCNNNPVNCSDPSGKSIIDNSCPHRYSYILKQWYLSASTGTTLYWPYDPCLKDNPWLNGSYTKVTQSNSTESSVGIFKHGNYKTTANSKSGKSDSLVSLNRTDRLDSPLESAIDTRVNLSFLHAQATLGAESSAALTSDYGSVPVTVSAGVNLIDGEIFVRFSSTTSTGENTSQTSYAQAGIPMWVLLAFVAVPVDLPTLTKAAGQLATQGA